MNIRSILIKLGGFLLAPFGAIHDALRGSASGVMTSSTISESASSEDVGDAIIGNTIKYYIGGTFLVTFLVVVFSCGGFAALGKKKRTYTRKRKPYTMSTKRRLSRGRKSQYKRATKRRRTYKRKTYGHHLTKKEWDRRLDALIKRKK